MPGIESDRYAWGDAAIGTTSGHPVRAIRRVLPLLACALLAPGMARAATTLELLTLGSPGKEFETWGTAFTVSNPQLFTFRWSTTSAGAAGADWEVTTTNAANMTVSVVKGTLATAPPTGSLAMFNIAPFLPATPPASATKYFVRITAHDKQAKPLGTASSPVTITYEAAGPPVHFNGNLDGPPLTAIEPGHPGIRFIRYDPLTQLTTGRLELEVFNDGDKPTDAVDVRIADLHQVVRGVGAAVHVPSLPKKGTSGDHRFITITLAPQLTVGETTVEGDWDKWRGRYATGFRIFAGSSKTGSAFVQWQQPPIAGRAGYIVAGTVPEGDADASAKVRKAIEDRINALMAGAGGLQGFLLKRVGGPVEAGQFEDLIFEPASSIKVIINFHAFRLMETEPGLKLTTKINWFQDYDKSNTSCPVDTSPETETLHQALTAMMQQSDNRATQALRVFFGQAAIDNTAKSIGMANTLYEHRDGCAADAVSHPNQLTLRDAATLYEGVASGSLLSTTSRTGFYLR